jgi:hypothetical protein
MIPPVIAEVPNFQFYLIRGETIDFSFMKVKSWLRYTRELGDELVVV